MGRIRRDFTYKPGVTGIHTQVAEVLAGRLSQPLRLWVLWPK